MDSLTLTHELIRRRHKTIAKLVHQAIAEMTEDELYLFETEDLGYYTQIVTRGILGHFYECTLVIDQGTINLNICIEPKGRITERAPLKVIVTPGTLRRTVEQWSTSILTTLNKESTTIT